MQKSKGKRENRRKERKLALDVDFGPKASPKAGPVEDDLDIIVEHEFHE